jgi:Winged helix DNA-binding domain
MDHGLWTKNDLNRHRLINQQIAGSRFQEPAALVSWLGGLQAQDYAQAKWAIGSRLPDLTEEAVEQAIASRALVRTWPMRGTLHLVAAADVRWLLTLLAPRLIAANATRYRQLELDTATLMHSQQVLARVLAGGKQLTRPELTRAFNQAGIDVSGQRLSHILQRAALDQLICFGARQGKEFTYTLLEEWVPAGKALVREQALAELARRYFYSRGPATLADFGWWSGLAAADARAALEMIKPELHAETMSGQQYWLPPAAAVPQPETAPAPEAYLLAGFEEYILGYKDRSASLDNRQSQQVVLRTGIIHPVMVLNGRVIGTWKRTFKKSALVVETKPLQPLSEAEQQAFAAAARRYARFMNQPLAF